MMIVVMYDGVNLLTSMDEYLICMYDDFLLNDYGETLEYNEDYIPYRFGDCTYIVMREEEYNNMSNADLNTLMCILKN